jgi:2-polyprenyl-6-methoxyphenol hydroxylase-like FAD-dependent oxidoreductase
MVVYIGFAAAFGGSSRYPDVVTSTDVLIIGAGPAGTAAAITLADHGTSVMVVDKAIFPRDKCCGDGLTTAALRILEGLGFTPDMVPSWQPIDAAWVRSPSGREVSLPFPEGRGVYGAVVPRRELDAALVQLARSKGAEIWEGCGLTSIRTTGETVEAEVDGMGTVHANYVIAADGMWSPTRKMLGLAGEPYLANGMRFVSTPKTLRVVPPTSCGSGLSPICFRGTCGAFRFRAIGPTLVSASCVTACARCST